MTTQPSHNKKDSIVNEKCVGRINSKIEKYIKAKALLNTHETDIFYDNRISILEAARAGYDTEF